MVLCIDRTLDYCKYRIFLLRQNVYMNNSKQLILRDFIDEKLRLQDTVEERNIDAKTVCERTELWRD